MNAGMKKESCHFAALKNIWFQSCFIEKPVDSFLADSENVKKVESK